MFGTKTFEIKKLLFPKDINSRRVETFRQWREIVTANPERFRISVFKITKATNVIGGVVFGLEALVKETSHVKSVFISNWGNPNVELGPIESKKEFVEDWTIIDYTDLWQTE